MYVYICIYTYSAYAMCLWCPPLHSWQGMLATSLYACVYVYMHTYIRAPSLHSNYCKIIQTRFNRFNRFNDLLYQLTIGKPLKRKTKKKRILVYFASRGYLFVYMYDLCSICIFESYMLTLSLCLCVCLCTYAHIKYMCRVRVQCTHAHTYECS